MRLIIVARADIAQKANEAAKLVDREGGERTFTVPLARPSDPSTPVAYWCGWDLVATRHQVQHLRDRLVEKGATHAEVTPVPPGERPASKRFGVFRADQWTRHEVLTAVGLVRVETGGG